MTSALRNKPRPVGGLKKNIMMYQQNRREVRRNLQENKQHHRSCFLEELAEDSDKQQLLQPGETNKRVSSSAGELQWIGVALTAVEIILCNNSCLLNSCHDVKCT